MKQRTNTLIGAIAAFALVVAGLYAAYHESERRELMEMRR